MSESKKPRTMPLFQLDRKLTPEEEEAIRQALSRDSDRYAELDRIMEEDLREVWDEIEGFEDDEPEG